VSSPRGGRVLELGCASGYICGVPKQRLGCAVVGVELFAEEAERARAHCERLVIGDVERLHLVEPDRRSHRRRHEGGAGGRLIHPGDQEAWACGPLVDGRTRVPFLEREGRYWGPPADDRAAIAELERQRERGQRFFVVAYPHLWYLDHYRGLRQWLARNACARLDNDRVTIFELTGS
jgi:hypothetical protein